MLAEELVASKVAAVVSGGATRAESVRAALAEVPDDALVVLVHDAARPLVDDAVIERVLGPLAEGCDGVVPGLPLCRHRQAGRRRARRRNRRPLVARRRADAAGVHCRRPSALRIAASDPVDATDCASLVEARGGRDSCRRRGCPPAEDHDRGRSRARRVVALRAVFFDVGETLVDEERWWRLLAERAGAAAARRLGGALGSRSSAARSTTSSGVISGSSGRRRGGRSSPTSSATSTPTRSRVSRTSGRSGCASGSSAIRRPRSSGGRATPRFQPT